MIHSTVVRAVAAVHYRKALRYDQRRHQVFFVTAHRDLTTTQDTAQPRGSTASRRR